VLLYLSPVKNRREPEEKKEKESTGKSKENEERKKATKLFRKE
jgi:hypothetical protein